MAKTPPDTDFNVYPSPSYPEVNVGYSPKSPVTTAPPSISDLPASLSVRVRVPNHGSKTIDQIDAEAIDLARVKFKALIRAYRGKDED